MKKTWNPPKLVVLARSEPEEVLLLNCKGNAEGAKHHSCSDDGSGGPCSSLGNS